MQKNLWQFHFEDQEKINKEYISTGKEVVLLLLFSKKLNYTQLLTNVRENCHIKNKKT